MATVVDDQSDATRPGTAELPTVFDGRYVLEQRLGGGGMGVVYRARDLIAEKRRDRNPYVALKLISESLRGNEQMRTLLQRECSRAQKLSHPNIVRVYYFDCEESTDSDYLIMELLRGESLERVVRACPSGMPLGRAVPIIRQLCDGLQYAHGEGIVHSDIKPSNLFLTDAGNLKILDFGIAAPLRGAETASSETLLNPRRMGAVAPRYSSLEMFLGKDADPSDDVYSVGCVIYELLTGQHPYQALETPRAAELDLTPERVPCLSRAQNRALRKALRFRRAERTATIAELRRDLLDQPAQLASPGLRYALGAVVIAVVTAGAISLRSHWIPQQPRPTSATQTPGSAETEHPAAARAAPAPEGTPPATNPSLAGGTSSAPVAAGSSLPIAPPAAITRPAATPFQESEPPAATPVAAAKPPPATPVAATKPAIAPPVAVARPPAATPVAAATTPVVTTATRPAAHALSEGDTTAQSGPPARPARGAQSQRKPQTQARVPSESDSGAGSVDFLRKKKTEDPRCASILDRMQLGETLGEEERTYYKQNCQ